MEPSRLRSIVAFSAAATLLYTPLFKKLTAIKNATVATVVALAPVAGALAAGAVRHSGLQQPGPTKMPGIGADCVSAPLGQVALALHVIFRMT